MVTGRALGREGDGRQLVADLEAEFAAAAAAHPEFAGLEVVVAERFEPGETTVRAGSDPRGRFFELLGFDVSDEIAGAPADQYGEFAVSDELMADLSRDLLVWSVGAAPELRAKSKRWRPTRRCPWSRTAACCGSRTPRSPAPSPGAPSSACRSRWRRAARTRRSRSRSPRPGQPVQ